jgi:hypothetical protein
MINDRYMFADGQMRHRPNILPNMASAFRSKGNRHTEWKEGANPETEFEKFSFSFN